MLNRSKLWALGLLFAAFAAGIAVGAGVHAAADGQRRAPRPSYVDRLTQDLTLTTAQRDTVALILQQYDTSMEELWGEMRPRMDAIRLDIRGQIKNVLSDGQRTVYDSLTARWDSIRAAREATRGR